MISVVLVSGSHCSGRLRVAYEYENWMFSGDVSFRWWQCFATTVDTCSASVLRRALEEFLHTFSKFAADSDPEAFLLHSV